MSSLHDLIKKIRVEEANLESYVYYDKETGKIHKISSSNVPDNNYQIIKVSNDEVAPILTGERRTEEFVIIYDLNIKEIRLKEISFNNSYNTANTMVYLLPVTKEKILERDVNVCQNIKQGFWKINLNSTTKRFLKTTNYNFKEKMYFSITSKFDPNILYRSLECTISDLLSNDEVLIPFKYDIEYSEQDVSIYTVKYFENYSHEVING